MRRIIAPPCYRALVSQPRHKWTASPLLHHGTKHSAFIALHHRTREQRRAFHWRTARSFHKGTVRSLFHHGTGEQGAGCSTTVQENRVLHHGTTGQCVHCSITGQESRVLVPAPRYQRILCTMLHHSTREHGTRCSTTSQEHNVFIAHHHRSRAKGNSLPRRTGRLLLDHGSGELFHYDIGEHGACSSTTS